MFSGIDVSYSQGRIDWSKVKTDFAILRDGYGKNSNQVDAQFERNYTECKKYGIPVGVYHYSYATTVEGAQKEADFVLSLLKGKTLEYPVWYDVEEKAQKRLSKKELTAVIEAFCKKLEAAGWYVGIYSFKSMLESNIDTKKLGRDVWVAQWTNKCTFKGTVSMWQYSDSGARNGIKGAVDLDYSYKDYPSIMKKEGKNGYKKTVVKKKSVAEIAQEVIDGKWGDKTTKPTRKERLEMAGYNYNEVQKKVTELLKKKEEKPKTYKKGDGIMVKNKSLYASATAKSTSVKKTGTYYIYDGVKVNGRYRVTNNRTFCGKKPEGLYVSGWMEL